VVPKVFKEIITNKTFLQYITSVNANHLFFLFSNMTISEIIPFRVVKTCFTSIKTFICLSETKKISLTGIMIFVKETLMLYKKIKTTCKK